MTREEQIEQTKAELFPIGDNGRSYELALSASGFDLGVNWADEQYNSYKTSIKSIKECIERFRECGNDKDDLINNIYIKCKDAIEYNNVF